MSKAADKIRQVLAAPLGPNVPQGASKQFVNLVKAIGEAGSNHVRIYFLSEHSFSPHFFFLEYVDTFYTMKDQQECSSVYA